MEEIVDLSSLSVFADATTYPIVLVMRKGKLAMPLRYANIHQPDGGQRLAELLEREGVKVEQGALLKAMWPPPTGTAGGLVAKLEAAGPPLEELASHIFQGLVTSADRVYTVILEESGKPLALVRSRATRQKHQIDAALLEILIDGKAVSRYFITPGAERLLFPYDLSLEPPALIPAPVLQSAHPAAWDYLCINRSLLEERENGKMRGGSWYGYVYPKNLALHSKPKLIVPRLVHDLEVAFDPQGTFYLDNVDVGGVILRDERQDNYLYVLSVLNSRAANFYFRCRSAPFRGGYRSANRQFLAPIPIPSSPEPKRRRAVTLARRMLDLHQRLAAKGDVHDSEREINEREIAQTDRQIDDLVYDLYGLTAKERALIEQEVRR